MFGPRSAPLRAPRQRSVPAVGAAVACIVGMMAAAPSPALATTGPTAGRNAAPAVAPAPPSNDEASALRAAQSTGQPVPVESARSETSDLVANPDGTLTLTEHTEPVRARRSGRWVPIDTTLVPSGGRLRPAAALTDVSFSTGGHGPLVRVVKDGRSIELSWPTALRAPDVDGSRATYPEVFPEIPGIDLSVLADTDGFSQALVVKTPQAARKLALTQVQFAMRTAGLQMRTGGAGITEAVNPAGEVILATSTARMWDSAGTPTQSATSTRTTATKATTDEPRPSDTQPSELDPGTNAANVGVKIAEDSLTLIPDRELLTDPDTVFPVYIDPRTTTGGRQAWTLVYKRFPKNSYWNGTGWGNGTTDRARVGYENEDGSTSRSFFRIDSRAVAGKEIIAATFNVRETHSWSCQKRPVQLWLTGAISNRTTWQKQPKWIKRLNTKDVAHGYEAGGCPDAGVDFNATYAATKAAAGKWKDITLGLKAKDEKDTYAWKKFRTDAKLIIKYNSRPSVPTGLSTEPSTQNAKKDCGITGPRVTIGNTDLKLKATVKDPDGGTVKGVFKLWVPGKYETPVLEKSVSVTSGKVASLKVGRDVLKKALPNGGTFGWHVHANDGRISSVGTAPVGDGNCHFQYDPVRPGERPQVTSPQYPNGDDGTVGEKARTPGQFRITNGGVKDVVAYEYGLDRNPPTEEKYPERTGDPVTVPLTPMSAGPHVLYVRSRDAANNVSDTETYLFYAASTGVRDAPGDVNGDGNPDLYAIHRTPKNGATPESHTVGIYAGTGAGKAPVRDDVSDAPGWAGALLTHRGDWTEDGTEDLVARRKDGKLWLHPVGAFGSLDDDPVEISERQAADDTAPGPSDPVDDNDPSPDDPPVDEPVDGEPTDTTPVQDDDPPLDLATITQIVSLGDVTTMTPEEGAGTTVETPDLVAVAGDQLWFVEGGPEVSLRDTTLIGDRGWSGTSIAAAGDHDGDGFPDLFVREKASGKLSLYKGKADTLDATRFDPSSLGSGANRVAVEASGWSAAARPLITGTGDADGDGISDLWSTDSTGKLQYVRSRRGQAGHPPVVVGETGWDRITALS